MIPRAPPAETEGSGGARVAFLSLPKAGETANGDRPVVQRGPGDRMVLGIVDALGHGVEAEEVALLALDAIARASSDASVETLMQQVHGHLRGSRGAAATLCVLSGGYVEACGVGNVDLRCHETAIPFVVSPGILGMRVQRFRTCRVRMAPGSRVVFFSDGIDPVNRVHDFRKLSPADACRSLLHLHRRKEDDATVLVADLE
jgi:negative regulator of sigma-B (phosphoserine phosphatase)